MTGPGVSIVVDRRFRGPDDSGNGGYTSGLVATRAGTLPGGRAATVTLRVPPPLDVPMPLMAEDGRHTLRHGDTVVAEVVPSPLDVAAVEPVTGERAAATRDDYAGLVDHPFPHCFVCGTRRSPGDGLRLAPGPLGDGSGRTACVWVPDGSLADRSGAVAPEHVWASLDCPGAWSAAVPGRLMVLGRIAARVADVPAVGETCVVMGRLLGHEGRKTFTATTTYGGDGRELGRAHATWITLPPS